MQLGIETGAEGQNRIERVAMRAKSCVASIWKYLPMLMREIEVS
jgi:hypothetical protein